MLGLYPIGSRAISSAPFSLVAVSGALSATLTITFTAGGLAGLPAQMSSNIGISLPVTANWIVHQMIAANVTVAFGGTPTLYVLGKPIKITALPSSYAIRAMPSPYSVKAMPQSFTIRGSR